MHKDYKLITNSLSASIQKLRKEIPDVMKGFSSIAQEATAHAALDKKTKELIALALGISAHCDGCIGFHSQALARLGAKREEILEVLGMSIYMGGGPALMYAAEALIAFEQAMEDHKS